jgi:GNAT superfamily N-acetyltransferase
MQTPYWTNRAARPDETAAVLRLVRAVHGEEHPELDEAYWRWRYLNDTRFRAEIIMAEHQGQPIGIQPLSVFDWQWGKARVRGAMYTGVLTHPDHRRRGVFRSLIDSSNEHAARCGALFSMTMPNDESLPGFLKFGDWLYPAPIPLWLKIIDGRMALTPKIGRLPAAVMGPLTEIFFKRRGQSPGPGDVACERTHLLPDEFDGVFDDFARDCGALMLRRTSAYWNWRYGAKPGSAYQTLVLRQDGRLAGAVVTSVGRRMGLDIGMVLDVVGRGGVPIIRRLLREAELELHSRRLGLVACQATSPLLENALREEGYWRPKPGWLPKRFHWVFRPTGLTGLPGMPSRLCDWHLTLGDSDNA